MSTATEMTPTVELGQVFSYSWGYDQTNVDFYQVVKVGKSTVVNGFGSKSARLIRPG